MKVLILNEDLGLGGVESMLVQLANALTERENFRIYVASAPGPLVKRLNSDIGYFQIPKYNFFSIKKLIKALSKIISETKVDIIHSQGATLSVLAGIAIKKADSRPINILTRHSRSFHEIPNTVAGFLINRYCDHIIALSETKHKSLSRAGIKAENISHIPNFVDCDEIAKQVSSFSKESICRELNIPSDSHIVTMIGRLIPAKRFDKFIRILAQCSTRTKRDFAGLIIGDGESRSALDELAENYSDQLKILFLGYQKNVYKYLSISDVFLFPSEHPEVLPMVLIEALSSGIPIVCSNIPGNNDIVIDGYNGFLINGTEKEYSDRFLKILQDQDLALRISNNAIKTARYKYDKEVVVNKIISLYKNLLYDYSSN
jgi:glycosyltransferase involved in cell wall biosynthesis